MTHHRTDWDAVWMYCADVCRNKPYSRNYTITNATLAWMVWKENDNRVNKIGWAAGRQPFLKTGMELLAVTREMARRARAEFGPMPRPHLGPRAASARHHGIEAFKGRYHRNWNWRVAA